MTFPQAVSIIRTSISPGWMTPYNGVLCHYGYGHMKFLSRNCVWYSATAENLRPKKYELTWKHTGNQIIFRPWAACPVLAHTQFFTHCFTLSFSKRLDYINSPNATPLSLLLQHNTCFPYLNMCLRINVQVKNVLS
jgi:hypothetical protein